MINIKRKEDCVGCGACLDTCHKGAISWKIDIEGFWYPVVNPAKCIECGLCEKVCPVLNAGKLNKTNEGINPKVYASYNTTPEIRFKSTSGGIYSALAEKMLTDGGYIGGAVWTDDFQAKHIISGKSQDLSRIMGSKYLQSDSTGMYAEIKRLLSLNSKILVCGCPCQMAALRSFLHYKEYENLIIVDFICCSINSPKLFRKYIDCLEEKYGAKCLSYHPKNKEYGGWHKFAFKAEFSNGKVYAKNGTEDDFTECFIGTHLAARPCCYECRFKQIPRISDITIADFWGIENVDPEMDSPEGTSLVILNNAKGMEYYRSLENSVLSKEETLEQAAAGNAHLYQPLSRPNLNRAKFYSIVEEQGFCYAMKKIGRPQKPLWLRIASATRKILKLR